MDIWWRCTGDKRLKNDIKIGDKFGLWTVIGESKKTDSSYNKYYVCQCICGTLRDIQRSKLISGHTKKSPRIINPVLKVYTGTKQKENGPLRLRLRAKTIILEDMTI